MKPTPAGIAPELLSLVTPGFDEREKLPVRYRRAGNAKGWKLDSVRPLLIIENERKFRSGADYVSAAWNLGIAQRFCLVSVLIGLRPSAQCRSKLWRGIPQGLPRV